MKDSRPSLNELPEILTAQDIANYLGVGRKRVYELMQLSPRNGGLVWFNLGKSKRVEKRDLVSWIDKRKKKEAG